MLWRTIQRECSLYAVFAFYSELIEGTFLLYFINYSAAHYVMTICTIQYEASFIRHISLLCAVLHEQCYLLCSDPNVQIEAWRSTQSTQLSLGAALTSG